MTIVALVDGDSIEKVQLRLDIPLEATGIARGTLCASITGCPRPYFTGEYIRVRSIDIHTQVVFETVSYEQIASIPLAHMLGGSHRSTSRSRPRFPHLQPQAPKPSSRGPSQLDKVISIVKEQG